MNDPLISVIMPAYNCSRFVSEAIMSVKGQTYKHWELLICDDGSTDETYAIAGKFLTDSRIRLFQNQSNMKLLKTRNKLLELAKGDLITFQDADDYSDPSRLERMVAKFRSNPRLGLLASQVGYINSRGDLLRLSSKPSDYESLMNLIYSENVVGGSMMMITRQAWQSAGGKFRSYFDGLSYQDYDLSFLIAEKYECYCLPDVLYYYRQHGRSNSKIISADRLLAKEIVIHLARQRRARGSDDLIDGHPEKVDAYLDLLREPYAVDPSLVYRQFAASFMFEELYREAICASWRAVVRGPANWINWRTLLYCVRKSVANRMYGKDN